MTENPTARAAQLVSIDTVDGVQLDGLLTEPEERRAGIVYLHGKGCNFYSGPGRFVPERSRLEDVCHLSINMRCHDLGYTRTDIALDMPMPAGQDDPPPVGGGMWEVLADGHKDVGAAVTFLRERGYDKVFVAGHSSGGFYAVDYCARDRDIAGRILLSPLTSNKTPFRLWFAEDGGLEEPPRAPESSSRPAGGTSSSPCRRGSTPSPRAPCSSASTRPTTRGCRPLRRPTRRC
jgi:pimeloyl-ACP methyl ester carboxylesterase